MPSADQMLSRLASTPYRQAKAAQTNPRRTTWATAGSGLVALVLGLSTAVTACSESSSDATSGKGGAKSKGGSGAGGAAAGSGSGGCTVGTAGQAAMPACIMPAKWVGKLVKPAPLVSVGKPVFTNSTDQANKGLLVDGKYKNGNGLVFKPTAATTTWASIDLGTGFSRLLLVWKDIGSTDYAAPTEANSTTDYSLVGGVFPTGYLIKTSSDSTNGEDGTWTTVATVADNAAPARSHVVAFTGMRWVRFEVTSTPVVSTGEMRVARIDEIELHDISAIGPGEVTDSWFIMGDSITKMTFDRARQSGEFDKVITAQRPSYSPAVIGAGIGYETAADALRHLQTEAWLENSEGLNFVTLAYGTNDSWCGSCTPESKGFETTLRSIIKVLTDANRVPVLARIPWNTVSPASVPQFNAVIDKLQQEFELPCGPDLYSLVAAHPEYIGATGTVQPNCTIKYAGTDGVHPQTSAAKNAIQAAYADAVLPLYPTP